MASRDLTYDQKKAAEAAFRGTPCDPKWSQAARSVYDGIIQALHAKGPLSEFSETVPVEVPVAESDLPEPAIEGLPADISEASQLENAILNREEAIQAGILIDVTPLAQELGLNLPVGISKPLWEIGITASHKLHDEQYPDRVRDVLMALRLHLETSEVTSPWIKFPALLSFPPDVAPQVCSLYAVAHKDPSAPYSLTLLLPHEMSAIKPSDKN